MGLILTDSIVGYGALIFCIEQHRISQKQVDKVFVNQFLKNLNLFSCALMFLCLCEIGIIDLQLFLPLV